MAVANLPLLPYFKVAYPDHRTMAGTRGMHLPNQEPMFLSASAAAFDHFTHLK